MEGKKVSAWFCAIFGTQYYCKILVLKIVIFLCFYCSAVFNAELKSIQKTMSPQENVSTQYDLRSARVGTSYAKVITLDCDDDLPIDIDRGILENIDISL